MSRIVMVSGGFDPLHVGHVQMMEAATEYGDVIVALNSDEWLLRKKGYVFMPWKERAKIILAIRWVTNVVAFDDTDDTAINAITSYYPDYFANGGDRGKGNVPEEGICEDLDVKMLWGIGGEDKPQSSSWLVNKAMEQLRESSS